MNSRSKTQAHPDRIAETLIALGWREVGNHTDSRLPLHHDDKRKARCFCSPQLNYIYIKVQPGDHSAAKAMPIVAQLTLESALKAANIPTLQLAPEPTHGTMYGRLDRRKHKGTEEIAHGLAMVCDDEHLALLFNTIDNAHVGGAKSHSQLLPTPHSETARPEVAAHESDERAGISEQRFPLHGPIPCRRCWPTDSKSKELTTSDKQFRVINDPGAWGASDPEVLVLGISKGFTQAQEFAAGEFDRVPFKNCRPRVRDTLAAIGLMDRALDVNAAMRADEQRFGWGSLVRCSLSGWNNKKQAFGAGTPEVLPAFEHPEAKRFLTGCMDRYLSALPPRTRFVVLLGNDDGYMATFAEELRRLYPSVEKVNKVAHKTGSVLWVHTAHPSPGNGHFSTFISGSVDQKQGLKRDLAQRAVASHKALLT